MNPNVNHCIFCQGIMSQTLNVCPHCHKSQKILGPCRVCSENVYEGLSDWESFYHRSGLWGQSRLYVHKACFQSAVEQVNESFSRLRCPDCSGGGFNMFRSS